MAVQAMNRDYIEEIVGMAEELDPAQLGTSEVIKFFDGCNILITGGSGFIGKLLLEKLLR